jgi:hypothetical protein
MLDTTRTMFYVESVSMQGSAELRGGTYMNPINHLSPTFTKVAQLFN